ncbi:MAG: DUF4230 domain-containing protein [Candidatus Amulumruptor caecigallinarius]|nr:DUF4230 domain-containing protein [Candidatus Amulumruptor caecigallinarius]MCM1396772.1 DUF4230 domain-containing protein [Candidatus Amulumruptor caecigallinarius]MCM1454533.1 DUF4230 domain-containing protein [bacterium]
MMKKLTHTLVVSTMLGLLASCSPGEADRSFYSEVKSVNKLVLAQMAISKMATVDDMTLDEASGMKQTLAALTDAAKIGSRKAAYSYDTYLRAYIDLSTLQPEDVKVDGKEITLNLPPIQTEFTGRDIQIREEHYRVTGLRSEIDPKERAAIKEKMNASLKKEVEEKPLFRNKLTEEARAKAVTYFKSLLGKDGYTVNVNFK